MLDYLKEKYFKDNKSYTKFVKKLASTIRSTIEYEYQSNNIREKYAACSECGDSKIEGAKLEVHHTPLTLFDIIDAHLKQKAIKVNQETKDIELKQNLTDIVKDVLKYHLDNEVGYKVLCSCCHKKAHRNIKDKFHIFDDEPEEV